MGEKKIYTSVRRVSKDVITKNAKKNGSDFVREEVFGKIGVKEGYSMILSFDTENHYVVHDISDIHLATMEIGKELLQEFAKAYSIDKDVHDCDTVMSKIAMCVVKLLDSDAIAYFYDLSDVCEAYLVDLYNKGVLAKCEDVVKPQHDQERKSVEISLISGEAMDGGEDFIIGEVWNILKLDGIKHFMISYATETHIFIHSKAEIENAVLDIDKETFKEFAEQYGLNRDIHDCSDLLSKISMQVSKILNPNADSYFCELEDTCGIYLATLYEKGILSLNENSMTKSEIGIFLNSMCEAKTREEKCDFVYVKLPHLITELAKMDDTEFNAWFPKACTEYLSQTLGAKDV